MNVLASLAVFAQESEETFHAHSPLWPETLEIIWGGTAFLVVAFMLWKYAVPAMKKGMQARSERIQRELDNAAKAKADADAQAADIRTRLGDIDAERARMLADADQTAARVLSRGPDPARDRGRRAAGQDRRRPGDGRHPVGRRGGGPGRPDGGRRRREAGHPPARRRHRAAPRRGVHRQRRSGS